MGIPVGQTNSFPQGQCTWWADFRYHQLTGAFIPWIGNAMAWLAGAQGSGWSVSGTAPAGIPSLVILQPGVQGASSLGHVGVVEKINADGSVVASNQNWGTTDAQRASTQYVTFRPGPGVSFAWNPDAKGSLPGAANGTIPTNSNTATAPNSALDPIGAFWGAAGPTFKQWGEYAAIFAIAVVLIIVGFVLIGGGPAVNAVKKGIAAGKGEAAT